MRWTRCYSCVVLSCSLMVCRLLISVCSLLKVIMYVDSLLVFDSLIYIFELIPKLKWIFNFFTEPNSCLDVLWINSAMKNGSWCFYFVNFNFIVDFRVKAQPNESHIHKTTQIFQMSLVSVFILCCKLSKMFFKWDNSSNYSYNLQKIYNSLFLFPFVLEIQSTFISFKQIAFLRTLFKGDATISLFYGCLPRTFLCAPLEFISDCSFLYCYSRFCVGPCTRTSTELHAITTARCRFPLSTHFATMPVFFVIPLWV